MNTFIKNVQYFNNSEKAKYVLISLGIFYFIYLFFSKLKNQGTAILQLVITIAIVYLLLSYDLYNKKTEEKKLLSINGEEASDEFNTIIKNDIEGFKILKKIIYLRNNNKQTFDKFIKNYNGFLLLKENILTQYNTNLKIHYEQMQVLINNMLNLLSSMVHTIKHINEHNLLSNIIKEFYIHFHNNHLLEVTIFLKNKFKENKVTTDSFPLKLNTYQIQPSNLEQNEFDKHYSVF